MENTKIHQNEELYVVIEDVVNNRDTKSSTVTGSTFR